MFFYFLILSFFEVLGISLIGPYLSLIFTDNSSFLGDFPELTSVYFENDNEALIFLGCVLIVIFISKAMAAFYVNFKIIKFSRELHLDMHTSLLKKYLNQEYIQYCNRNSSEYIYNLQHLVRSFCNDSVINLLKLLCELFFLISIIFLLAYINIILFVTLLVIAFVVAYLYDLILKKRFIIAGEKTNYFASILIKNINETIRGFKEIRIMGNDEYFINQNKLSCGLYSNYYAKLKFYSIIPKYSIELIFVLLIVSSALYLLFNQQSPSKYVGMISIYGFAAIRIFPALNSIVTAIGSLRTTKDTVKQLFSEFHEIEDCSAHHTPLSNKLTQFDSLVINNVDFRHHKSSNHALTDVSLEIRRGDCIGLVGESGSGKTTLMNLMLGLYECSSGQILFNNSPLSESINIWRSQIAYLPQEQFVLDDSIKRNVALGIVDDQIDIEKVHSSLRKAMLSDYINSLPNGIETEIGDNGVRISGGQKQRIGIARAFYHNRSIFLLDETTSALDEKTEKNIVEEFNNYRGEITMVIISHRLNSLKYCDKIYKITNGKLSRFEIKT